MILVVVVVPRSPTTQATAFPVQPILNLVLRTLIFVATVDQIPVFAVAILSLVRLILISPLWMCQPLEKEVGEVENRRVPVRAQMMEVIQIGPHSVGVVPLDPSVQNHHPKLLQATVPSLVVRNLIQSLMNCISGKDSLPIGLLCACIGYQNTFVWYDLKQLLTA